MDGLTAQQRRKCMKSIKSKDTEIEIRLRRALWKEGFRYRKNYAALPGKPDIALTKHKVAIFCDSEFFHGKDWDVLKKQLERGRNPDFRIAKIEGNRERDDEVNKQLAFLGWTVIRFWGKDIAKDTEGCVRTVKEAVFERAMEECGL